MIICFLVATLIVTCLIIEIIPFCELELAEPEHTCTHNYLYSNFDIIISIMVVFKTRKYDCSLD